MESYCTSNLPGRPRVTAWNEVYSSRLAHVEFNPVDSRRFNAALELGVLGPIRIARMRVDRCSIDRTPLHIGPAPGRFYAFVLQVKGHGLFRQYGREAMLSAGDFTLCDSITPHSMRVDDASEFVMLRIPADVLRGHLPSPEQFCGSRLGATEGFTHSAASLTLSAFNQLEIGLAEDYHARVARHVLDLIATSYAIVFDSPGTPSSIMSGRQANVRRYIEDHLSDPTLSPAAIAEGLKLSPRYLRMIFANDSDETVSAYILRRRLEESARQIADPHWRGHTITEIAFRWGFNSAPHFARSFRDRYDCSPREYRRRHQAIDLVAGPERPARALLV